MTYDENFFDISEKKITDQNYKMHWIWVLLLVAS